MKISYELDLSTFGAWSGAVDTLDRIRREGKCEALESILEDCYPEGMTETELNDLLWFEPDLVFEWLGMRTESEIRSEIDEAKGRIAEIEEEILEIEEEFESDCEGMTKSERTATWEENYRESVHALTLEKVELQDTIAELREELEEI